MQMSEKNLIDARSFQEIWKTLDRYQRQELSLRLQKSRCCATRQTVINWAYGHTQPNLPLIRKTISQVVGKYLNATTYAHTLFPSK